MKKLRKKCLTLRGLLKVLRCIKVTLHQVRLRHETKNKVYVNKNIFL